MVMVDIFALRLELFGSIFLGLWSYIISKIQMLLFQLDYKHGSCEK